MASTYNFLKISIQGKSTLFSAVTFAVDFLAEVLEDEFANGSCASRVCVEVVELSRD